MMKQNKWKMNRAGLLNFWYYDEEIFDFADGKLLLRGSNGSGKSVTMQSFLPVLLDGKTSSDRLDPFGSRARKMEDYLLGEKEIVDRDERTGYLFLEYKREDTNEYITTGIGLQARRYKNLNFWGFIITDNRRIGKDFFLYEYEQHAGEKQQIPLSRIQLENRIGTGGHVVRTRGEYRNLVNKYIFGFETTEAYDDLIKLLIQLRSPKLSKDFKPTVIYEILEASLPPLTEEDLRHLSDTIEHMDQTKQQMEQLEREREALQKVITRYDTYNQYRLAETAHHFLEAKKRVTKTENLAKEKQSESENLATAINQLEARVQELEQQKEILEKKQQRLEKHEVWNLAEEMKRDTERLTQVKKELTRKEETLTVKTKQELQWKEELKRIISKIDTTDHKMDDQLVDLEADADSTSFERHTLNVTDFSRKRQTDFQFSLWLKEADNHYQTLDQISERLRTFEQIRTQIAELENVIAAKQYDIDQLKHEQTDWEKIFEKDKQEKLSEIHRWQAQHSFLPIDADLLQKTARDIERLYEPVAYETIRQQFFEVSNQYQLGIHEKIVTKKSALNEVEEQIETTEKLIHDLKQKKDPDPPYFQEETKVARQRLIDEGYQYVPFYEAVEFQDHVDEAIQQKLEAALIDTGLLNALITNEAIPVEHDRILKPNAQLMAHTLADYLKPDLPEEAKMSAATVEEVLQSILIADDRIEENMAIGIDGTYKIGLVEGHAVPVASVRFIGKNARKRYREEQIAVLTAELEEWQEKKTDIQATIHKLEEKITAAQTAMNIFPNDEDLQTAYKHIDDCRFKIERLEKELHEQDEKLHEKMTTFQELKRKLDIETRDINLEFSHEAYQEAKQIQLGYGRALSHLEKLHVTYLHEQENKQQAEERLDELEGEVDELKGELNVLKDDELLLHKNIAEIEEQMKRQGLEDIQAQIKQVQREMTETTVALDKTRIDLPQKRADLNVLEKEIVNVKQQLKVAHLLLEVWSETFHEELKYDMIDKEEMDVDTAANWAVEKWKHLINESQKIEEHLTKAFFEQHSNLMEYRMTEFTTSIPKKEIEKAEWTDEQHILYENWERKASRRMIQLDFQGQRLSPYSVQQIVEDDYARQQHFLNEQDRQLYENILIGTVGNKLRSRILRAEKWTKQMNKLMTESDSTSGISFSIQWKPRTAETEAELDTKELVDFLRRDARLLKEEDLTEVMNHFRSKIDRAKEMIELTGEGDTLLQVLKEVLDYRHWFSFVLSYQRVGEPKRELTNNQFYRFSGGEKAMAMYIPLFTACYSRYLEADPAAPYIISLDEAFAGVDDDNISVMFRLVEQLGFDYIMNSQFLWGDYDTVSALSICELIRPKNANFVSVIRYVWDGKTRKLVTDEVEETESFV